MDGSGDYAGKYKNWSFVCGSSRVYLQFKESGSSLQVHVTLLSWG